MLYFEKKSQIPTFFATYIPINKILDANTRINLFPFNSSKQRPRIHKSKS